MKTDTSIELFEKAMDLFPGGVNSPVRAFGSVEGDPLFIAKGDGCRIWDEDGNSYIDFCCSWGPLILGHNHPKIKDAVVETVGKGMSFGAPTRLENQLASLIISNHRFIEKIRFVNSGTEATMSAIRLARGYTSRNKIIKFEGCYHGHADHLLVKAGSGLATFGTSSSAGVPEAFSKETIVLPLNDKSAVEQAFANHKDGIACMMIEPIPANNGLLLQNDEYLNFLRDMCTKNGTLLVFDEVISGFRVGFEGAAGYYDIQPDLITFGKVLGGGMPVGAYAGSKEIMSRIAPEGDVYQAGTLSGNPVAMAAGAAQLSECLKDGFYGHLETATKSFASAISREGFKVHHIGSIFWGTFSDEGKIQKAAEIDISGMKKFKVLHRELLKKGVYLGPSGYEVGFVSTAHSDQDLEQAVDAFNEALDITLSQ